MEIIIISFITVVTAFIITVHRSEKKARLKADRVKNEQVRSLLERPPIIEKHDEKRHLRVWSETTGTGFVCWKKAIEHGELVWYLDGISPTIRNQSVLPCDRKKDTSCHPPEVFLWHWIYKTYPEDVADKFRLEVSKRMYHDWKQQGTTVIELQKQHPEIDWERLLDVNDPDEFLKRYKDLVPTGIM